MNTKLTLRLDERLIASTKHYAAREGRSVSELVAAYFVRLDAQAHERNESTQTVTTESAAGEARKSRFYGLLANAHVDGQDADERAYRQHLAQKHK